MDTVRDQWQHFKAGITADITDAQWDLIKASYYAGALAIFALMYKAEYENYSAKSLERMLDSWFAECQAFIEQSKTKRKDNEGPNVLN
jgi:hypothetical protein